MKNFILLLFCLLYSNNELIAQEWNWIFSTETVDDGLGTVASPIAIETDSQGNVYMSCNSGHANISFGNQTFIGATDFGGRNFLVKFNSSGEIIWIRDTFATDHITIKAIAIDGEGNIYTTGTFEEIYNHDGYTFTTSLPNSKETFLSKMDSNGNVFWVKHLSIDSDDFIIPYDIAVDNTGNIFMTGQMRGSNGNFDGLIVPVEENLHTYVAKFNNHGNVLWVDTISDDLLEAPRNIACDDEGNLYLTRNTIGHTYLLKYNTNGDVVWNHEYGSNSGLNIYSNNLVVKDNYIYVVGTSNLSVINFGEVTLTPAISDSAYGYIVKYYTNGVALAAVASVGRCTLLDVKVNNNDSVYALGSFTSSQIQFGETTIINEGQFNTFVLRLDSDLNFGMIEKIGGLNHFNPLLTLDNHGTVYTAGNYYNIRFGNQILTRPMCSTYLAKLNDTSLHKDGFNKVQEVLYPNPAKDILNISGIKDASFIIEDFAGRKVSKGVMQDNSINVSGLTTGIYFISIGNTTKKFIKK